MKKIIFYISSIFCLILTFNISKILINDFERLNEYGFGYLVGKIILFIIFLILVLLTRKSILKKKVTE
ncbi:MAG: hypothetical protein ACJA2M_002776 [Polaribacter sp.]|jgi:hypothetical protein